jgi:cysteine synthase A
MICDGGERSYSKLYNPEFLYAKKLDPENLDIEGLIKKYGQSSGKSLLSQPVQKS